MTRVVVVGAGVGGLTAAALLARSGLDVTVLEAQVYPGGCASTFYHRGYRFDAGATLAAGFYPGGPMDLLGGALEISWPVRTTEEALVVHLPNGTPVSCWGSRERWKDTRQEVFGAVSEPFWQWQETTARTMWDLALRLPPWPPQSFREAFSLMPTALGTITRRPKALAGLALDAVRPVSAHLETASEPLRIFVDAQLLISAQTTSGRANALYGAAALDMPRRGVVHMEGGMGAIAETLVERVRRFGGNVLFRHEARRLLLEKGRVAAVETSRGGPFPADVVLANLPQANVTSLIHDPDAPALPPASDVPDDGWGAFVLYLGLDGGAVPAELPLHHQIVEREPMGEGNTVFLSLSPAWDGARAPEGKRAATLSTHTDLAPWWDLFERDQPAYQARKQAYTDRLIQAARRVLPELPQGAELVVPGTPVTFQRFTRRSRGWVGGFPQTNLRRTLGPRQIPGLWLVGDSIFPGQSTAAVALGGMRVAAGVLDTLARPGLKPWKSVAGS